MTSENKNDKQKPSEEEIDERVELQADDDSAWEGAVHVRKKKWAPLSIPGGLAARAAFLAKLHREKGLDEWLARIIRERVELEELALGEVKRELAAKGKASEKPSSASS
jgi:hypothetical protein